jgi:ribosomal protein S5
VRDILTKSLGTTNPINLVRATVQGLQSLKTPEGQARLAEGRMKLVGAVYEIATGRVRFLD